MRCDFITAMQIRTARCAIGASTLRGLGPPGLIATVRDFLATLPLEQFGTLCEAAFLDRLNAETERLRKKLPQRARKWGTARKLLNIFLRDALYNEYLRAQFGLHRAEYLLELPLDSITAGKLRQNDANGELPRWPGVSLLNHEQSDRYQVVATRVANGCRIARVHLDIFWWGGDRNGSR